VEEIVRAMDPSIPVANARTLGQVVDASMSRVTFTTLLLQVAALTALVLAAVGLYGVLTYLVSRRTREIGMRLAIGAEPRTVVGMVVGRALRLTGMGLSLGAVLAWVGGGVLDGLLHGVEAATPAVFAGAGAVLAAVALVAAWIPARRASRVDPATALRGE
jgi:ABC-type antimicrobial peptide transport system permease subunit